MAAQLAVTAVKAVAVTAVTAVAAAGRQEMPGPPPPVSFSDLIAMHAQPRQNRMEMTGDTRPTHSAAAATVGRLQAVG